MHNYSNVVEFGSLSFRFFFAQGNWLFSTVVSANNSIMVAILEIFIAVAE